jgi:mannose-6-phosphate isomerase-like protein (cupin superfamily)
MRVFRDREVSKRNLPFEVLGGTVRTQVASMVLQPGESSGEYGNEHAGSDQIMYVVEGEADVSVEGQELHLGPDDFVLIAAGEEHQVRCGADTVLRTVNFYAPPGY